MNIQRILIGAVGALALTACASTPRTEGERQQDMAQERADASQDVADAHAQANKDLRNARKDLSEAQKDSAKRSEQVAEEEVNVANAREKALAAPGAGQKTIMIAEAEARHTSQMQRCRAISSEEVRNRCEIDADAELQAVKRSSL